MSPTPCSKFTRSNGLTYVSWVGEKNENCQACHWPMLDHNFDGECANCKAFLPNRFSQRWVIANIVRNSMEFEKEEFCSHRCIKEYIEIWGY